VPSDNVDNATEVKPAVDADAAIKSPERTTRTTVRRVGLEGREEAA